MSFVSANKVHLQGKASVGIFSFGMIFIPKPTLFISFIFILFSLNNHQMSCHLSASYIAFSFLLWILKPLELALFHKSQVSIYSIYKPFTVYRWRILSSFTNGTCIHRYKFYLQRNRVCFQWHTLVIPESSQAFSTFKE